jgi:hypothetical protein
MGHPVRSDNMQWTAIKYRTNDTRTNRYARIPTIWLSDFLDWLTLSEHTVVRVTDNPAGWSGLTAPQDWPSYRACDDYIRVSDLVALKGR